MTSQTVQYRMRVDRPSRSLERRGRWNRLDLRLTPYVFISPYFILFALVGAFPLLFTAWVSLREWSLIGGDAGYVGLKNYTDVLAQPDFWNALRNTLSIFVLSVVPQLVMATAVAAALATNLRAKTFWRMGVLVPYVLAPVAVTLVFNDLFGDAFGLINQGLNAIGLSSVGWHDETLASHFAISIMVNFRWTGYSALILLAAMQAVPQEFIEAARLDGAGRLRTFFSITLPLIRPTMIFVVVTAVIGGLQIFDEPQLFSVQARGGPAGQWTTLTMYLYKIGWTQSNLGRASAVAWLLFMLIVLIGLVNLAYARVVGRGSASRRAG
ncbi:MAG: carbohydrate ABC transporter permease [Dermatophilaceae bacterium]